MAASQHQNLGRNRLVDAGGKCNTGQPHAACLADVVAWPAQQYGLAVRLRVATATICRGACPGWHRTECIQHCAHRRFRAKQIPRHGCGASEACAPLWRPRPARCTGACQAAVAQGTSLRRWQVDIHGMCLLELFPISAPGELLELRATAPGSAWGRGGGHLPVVEGP